MSKLQESTPVVVDPFEAVPSQMPTTATVTVTTHTTTNTSEPEDASNYRVAFHLLLLIIIISGITGGAYHYAHRND